MRLESLKEWYTLELDIYNDVDNVVGHEPKNEVENLSSKHVPKNKE